MVNRLSTGLFLVAAIACLTIGQAALTCKDGNNEPVDWFIVYKMPHFDIYFNDDDSGLNYAYVDSNKYDSWNLTYTYLNATGTPLTNTFNQLDLDTIQSSASVFWNDSPLNTDYTWAYAHSKGFMVTDEESGIYVPHTFPEFPSFLEDGTFDPYYSMQDVWFGNILMCMTMAPDQMDALAENLRINFPRVFDGNFPDSFEKITPSMKDYLNEVPRPDSAVKNNIDLETAQGVHFTNFAHNGTMNVPFFEDILADHYDTDLIVESWGRPYMPSSCSPDQAHNSMNVQYINFDVEEAFHFMSGRDHAKWQISTDPKTPHVCLGDLNRMPAQNHRGGGTNCFYDATLWQLFRGIVGVYEECDSSTSDRYF